MKPSTQFIFAANKYGEYCVPSAATHRPAAQCVINGEVWENDTIEFMVANCRDRDVITAGTFFGDALPALSAASTGTVWGFEPNPESYRCAAITVLLNDLKNVKLMNVALGEKPESKRLVVRGFDGRSLGGLSQIADVVNSYGPRGPDTVPVNVVAIDDVVPVTAKVGILHLDIEGFEEFALSGAFKTIERKRPALILETAPTAATNAGKLLHSLGYRVTRALSSNSLLQCDPLST